VGRPRTRWLHEVNIDARRMGIKCDGGSSRWKPRLCLSCRDEDDDEDDYDDDERSSPMFSV
jgi:hypothetical protein